MKCNNNNNNCSGGEKAEIVHSNSNKSDTTGDGGRKETECN